MAAPDASGPLWQLCLMLPHLGRGHVGDVERLAHEAQRLHGSCSTTVCDISEAINDDESASRLERDRSEMEFDLSCLENEHTTMLRKTATGCFGWRT